MTYFLLLLFGGAVGVLSGLLGIGGGLLLVPGLMWLFEFTQQEAQGTSLAVLIPPIGLFAALVYYRHGYVRLPVVAWLVVGFAVGAYFGARLLPVVPLGVLRILFGILALYIGFAFILTARYTTSAAALPAAVTTIVATCSALVVRRKLIVVRHPGPPPSDHVEYHI